MKIGQVLSFLDVGLVPQEYQEEFQKKLAELRDAAPTVTFKDMGKVIEAELDEPVEKVFEDFDEEPVAAASIGQVYRATLRTAVARWRSKSSIQASPQRSARTCRTSG